MKLSVISTVALVAFIQATSAEEAQVQAEQRTLRGANDAAPADLVGEDATDLQYDPEPAYTSHYLSAKQNYLSRDYGNQDDPNKPPSDDKALLSLTTRNCPHGFQLLYADSWESSLYDGYGTYPNNLYKCWLLDAGIGNRVNFRMIQTSIENSWDHLKAYSVTGFSTSSRTGYGKSLISTFTGYSSSQRTIVSSGRYMLLEFKTDYSVQGGGFYARYKEYQTSSSRCFYFIGTGYCRDNNNGVGSYRVRCQPGSSWCSESTCKSYCRSTTGCTGIEYRSGRCEVHTGGVTRVSYSSGTSCYTYEYCD